MSNRPIHIHIDELDLDGAVPAGLDESVAAALEHLMRPSDEGHNDGQTAIAHGIAKAIHAQMPPMVGGAHE